VILLQPAIAHLGESEDALQDAERPLHLGAHSGLGSILAPGLLVRTVLIPGPAAGHVLRLECGPADYIALPLITSISPHLLLRAVQ